MNKFKKLFSKYKIDGYIVPKNDEYFNEYIPAHKDRLKFISNFSGSAGFAILFAQPTGASYFVNELKFDFISISWFIIFLALLIDNLIKII